MMRGPIALALALAALGPAACSSTPMETTTTSSATGGGHGGEAGASSSASSGGAGGATPDGGVDMPVDDGTPMRQACTSHFGNALSATYGRLDGYLVAVVPTSQHACNGDSNHVHLQILMHGAVYDVAVNTDVLYTEMDAPLPDGPWSEGWHTNATLDYTKDLGLHAGTFTITTPGALEQKLESELAAVNHISVFATGYGPDGAHLVHRSTFSHDGALALGPLSPKAHLLLFCFSDQGF